MERILSLTENFSPWRGHAVLFSVRAPESLDTWSLGCCTEPLYSEVQPASQVEA